MTFIYGRLFKYGRYDKDKLFHYIIAILYLFVVIAVITGKITGDKDAKNSHPEYLSREYIYGDYLFDKRFDDAIIFPVAVSYEEEEFYYVDSYGAARTYGGERLQDRKSVV